MTNYEIKEWVVINAKVTAASNDHWCATVQLYNLSIAGHGNTIERAYLSLVETIMYSHYKDEMIEEIKNRKKK